MLLPAGAFPPLLSKQKRQRQRQLFYRWANESLTVQDALPVVVGLNVIQVVADKLKINFVLNVREQDKSRHDTFATATLYLTLDLAIPDVVVVCEQSAHAVLGHGEDQVAILNLGETAVDPVGRRRVAKILGVQRSTVEVVPLVGLAFANRLGHAGVQTERLHGITAAETVSASSTLAIF